MKDDASLARKTTAGASSSTLPYRCIGASSIQFCRYWGSSTVVSTRVVCDGPARVTGVA